MANARVLLDIRAGLGGDTWANHSERHRGDGGRGELGICEAVGHVEETRRRVAGRQPAGAASHLQAGTEVQHVPQLCHLDASPIGHRNRALRILASLSPLGPGPRRGRSSQGHRRNRREQPNRVVSRPTRDSRNCMGSSRTHRTNTADLRTPTRSHRPTPHQMKRMRIVVATGEG